MQLREPETTNNTDLSSSAPMPATPRPRLRAVAWIGVAVAAAGITFVLTRHEAPRAPAASAPTLVTASASVIAPLASATPPPTSSETAAATTAARKPTSATHTAKPNCSPPFYFEKDGTKRFKAECL
jgi:hypothetical protein